MSLLKLAQCWHQDCVSWCQIVCYCVRQCDVELIGLICHGTVGSTQKKRSKHTIRSTQKKRRALGSAAAREPLGPNSHRACAHQGRTR